MNAVISQTIYFITSYVLIIGFFFFIVNFLSKGWLVAFLKVKSSRGKKSFVVCHGVADTYYRVGEFKGTSFKFIDRDKNGITITNIDREDVIHTMGVTGFEYDVPSGNVIKLGVTKPGCSPEETDNYIKRIIEAPGIEENFKKYVIILLIFILLFVIINLFFSYSNNEAIVSLTKMGVV
jgi:hypothetical protein